MVYFLFFIFLYGLLPYFRCMSLASDTVSDNDRGIDRGAEVSYWEFAYGSVFRILCFWPWNPRVSAKGCGLKQVVSIFHVRTRHINYRLDYSVAPIKLTYIRAYPTDLQAWRSCQWRCDAGKFMAVINHRTSLLSGFQTCLLPGLEGLL